MASKPDITNVADLSAYRERRKPTVDNSPEASMECFIMAGIFRLLNDDARRTVRDFVSRLAEDGAGEAADRAVAFLDSIPAQRPVRIVGEAV